MIVASERARATRRAARDPLEERLKLIPESALVSAIARTPLDQYVVWTGSAPVTRATSLRARALQCVEKVGVPVPLRLVVMRAARIRGVHGLDPDSVREALRQHQSANEAVVLLLRKGPDGSFVAVRDIRFAVDLGRRIDAGDVVLDRHGALVVRQGARA